ncbi:MAG: hypothetical protein BGO67_02990 [Alphaproteobacteria bacterium 41-28]|nr:MAG: hypothetical protein BGO67_02990 [Alphaproteobacteria bacterium 41-28]
MVFEHKDEEKRGEKESVPTVPTVSPTDKIKELEERKAAIARKKKELEDKELDLNNKKEESYSKRKKAEAKVNKIGEKKRKSVIDIFNIDELLAQEKKKVEEERARKEQEEEEERARKEQEEEEKRAIKDKQEKVVSKLKRTQSEGNLLDSIKGGIQLKDTNTEVVTPEKENEGGWGSLHRMIKEKGHRRSGSLGSLENKGSDDEWEG